MDTQKIKLYLDRDVLPEDIKRISSLKYVNSLSVVQDGAYIILSLPRVFYTNNIYLITKESEVKKGFKRLEKDLLIIGYKVIKHEIIKVDYPFTFMRKPQESFSSWINIWRLFGDIAKEKGHVIDLGENFGKNGLIIQDGYSKKNISFKISFYDPYEALKNRSPHEVKESIKDFPDLPQRIRAEVRQTQRKQFKTYKGKMLKEIKKSSYDILNTIIFQDLEDHKEKTIKKLVEYLKIDRDLKGPKFNIINFLHEVDLLIYDYRIIQEALRRSYLTEGGFKYSCNKVRRYLKEWEREGKKEHPPILFFKNYERIESLIKKFKLESNKKT